MSWKKFVKVWITWSGRTARASNSVFGFHGVILREFLREGR